MTVELTDLEIMTIRRALQYQMAYENGLMNEKERTAASLEYNYVNHPLPHDRADLATIRENISTLRASADQARSRFDNLASVSKKMLTSYEMSL